MIFLNFILCTLLTFSPIEIFNFNQDSSLTDWTVVNDAVMGGRSRGHFSLNEEGHAVFHGHVSLENNGGFSLVRHRFEQVSLKGYSKFTIHLRGDGKRYQLRVKPNVDDRHNYVTYFQTSGEWQTIEIPFGDMHPNFRGRKLDMPNYPGAQLAEIGFLIGNKKEESFWLEIDRIEVKK